jgi:hypothetical protein
VDGYFWAGVTVVLAFPIFCGLVGWAVYRLACWACRFLDSKERP